MFSLVTLVAKMLYDFFSSWWRVPSRIKDCEPTSSCPADSVMVETPRSLTVELMPYQKHALAFMMWRETQWPSRGLLSDELDLGKTLTMRRRAGSRRISRACKRRSSDGDYSK